MHGSASVQRFSVQLYTILVFSVQLYTGHDSILGIQYSTLSVRKFSGQGRVANPEKFANTKTVFENTNKYIFEFPKYNLNTEKVVHKCLLKSH